jgi:DNA (cytosine-5)-methyltransferase 1
MQEGHLSKAPIWPDIRTLPFEQLPPIDIIFGGFPCQDISIAGAGKGLAGERSGLFFEIVRLCRELRPSFIFLENVPAITIRGGRDVVGAITSLGYDCRWCIISAAEVGAMHKRERWFLLAHSKHDGTSASEDWRSIGKEYVQRKQQQQTKDSGKAERTSKLSSDVANANSSGLGELRRPKSIQTKQSTFECQGYESRKHWQETVSSMDKCSDGLSYHVDRLKALGNSVVPQQVRTAFKILMGIK